jgi:anthranilate synthase/aminodeoxychorismate synthase-like glutamine amidotransferase
LILFLDNFDSFSYNLVDYLGRIGLHCRVFRNDEPIGRLTRYAYSGVVLSPGPGVPSQSGIMNQVIAKYYRTHPILGICLGHQALGEFFGAKVIKAQRPMHGKISEIITSQKDVFSGLDEKLKIVRYHSLVLSELPLELEVTAKTFQGEIMAIKHQNLPITGLQFHPEAVMCQHGESMIMNWARLNNLIDG